VVQRRWQYKHPSVAPAEWGWQQNQQDLPGAGRSCRSNLDERVSFNKKEKAKRQKTEWKGFKEVRATIG
jgi:hypothetical protein